MPATTVKTVDGPMDMTFAEPFGSPVGAVLVVQEAFGVTSHIAEVCARFAAEGFVAVAPALYHRLDPQTFSYDDLPSALAAMGTLNMGQLDWDLDATLAELEQRGFGPARTGVVGFCMGGTVALHAAASRSLGAAVTYYGGGLVEGRFGLPPGVQLAAGLRTPWLGLYGDLDAGIPVADIEAVRAAIADVELDAKIVRYPDGQHGFNCEDRPNVFDAATAAAAWKETLRWLRNRLRAEG